MSAMDTDWCLVCESHFDGLGPYCSADCEDRAASSSSAILQPYYVNTLSEVYSYDEDEIIYHQVDDVSKSRWAGSGSADILAWAADIPSGAPVDSPSTHDIDDTALSPSSPMSSPLIYRRPKLLRPQQRPVHPSLCMSTPCPGPTYPYIPFSTPQQQMATLPTSRSGDAGSLGKTSLLSGASESSLATPVSTHPFPVSSSKPFNDRPSMLGAIATHVRSWVSPSPQLHSSWQLKRQGSAISATTQVDVQKFNVLSHTASSSRTSFDDDAQPIWWLSTAVLNPPSKGRKPLTGPPRRRPLALELPLSGRADLSYRPRGRKLSRAIA